MSSLALTSGWYYICTSYCTPDSNVINLRPYSRLKERILYKVYTRELNKEFC